MNVTNRIRAKECLKHKWITSGAPSCRVAKPTNENVNDYSLKIHNSKELRKLFRVAQNSVQFICRLKNIKYLKQCVDRVEIRKRPFRSKEVFFFSIFYRQYNIFL